MPGVRVVVTFRFVSVEVADRALSAMVEAFKPKQQEEGALEYQLFRSVEEPSKLILLEHWASKALYDKHWSEQVAREGVPVANPDCDVQIEFYQHACYELLDGVWQPSETADRSTTVRWA